MNIHISAAHPYAKEVAALVRDRTQDIVPYPWHERMTGARRWHARALRAVGNKSPELEAQLDRVFARLGKARCAADTRESVLAAYRRVIRRNLAQKGSQP